MLVSLETGIAVAVGLAAAAEDLTRRTISNWLPLTALAGGVLCQCLEKGWKGAAVAGAGAASGFGVFLLFYLLGGMGGGDVKLMAGFGALLGYSRLPEAAFWTALTGGLLAVVAMSVASLRARFWKAEGEQRRPAAIPYAPAIVAGVWITLLSQP